VRQKGSVGLVPQTRWAAYATAGAATALAGVNSAEADIHYSGILNITLNAPPGSTVLRTFALDNGAQLKFAHLRTATSNGGGAFFRIQGAGVSNEFRGVAVGGFRYPSNLGPGVNVSSGAFVAHSGVNFATLAYKGGYGNSQWLSKGTGFIGFKFTSFGGTEYGWAQLTMDGAPENSFTLKDFAWADPGTPIFTGETAVVPEPGTLGLLAVGAVGLLLWRRQRATAAH
jgi:PEP-CTERM motif